MNEKKLKLLCAVLAVLVVLLAASTVFFAVGKAKLQSDYKLYKNIISQDEVEQTLFGQPISPERNGEYRLAVKTAADGDFHAELSIYEAKDGKYEKIFSCPALVGKNGPGKQSEGDVKTPLGTWTIGEAYGIKDDPGSLVPFIKITDDMYWCATGSNGLNYNHLLYKSEHPDWDYSEDEHLMDYPSATPTCWTWATTPPAPPTRATPSSCTAGRSRTTPPAAAWPSPRRTW